MNGDGAGESGCGHLDAVGLAGVVAARLGISLPEAHADGARMARLALGVQAEKGAPFCALPFCCTVEAEALGASIKLGDGASGPRAGAFTCFSLRDVLRLKPMELSAGRISQALRACSALAEAGERAVLEMSGPLTILNWLMDLAVVFKEWRKDEALMREVLARLAEELRRYALAAGERGVAALSYADPAGSVAILGPKRFAFVADAFVLPFLRPFLRRLEAEAGFAGPLHVCPKTSHALVRAGRAAWRELRLDRPMGYAEGCLAAGRGALLGEACLKNAEYFLKEGALKRLVLT